jgi:GntR family transcriptional regulator, transcriptional repressor for pyruvate dehydrogenase complex
MTPQPLSPPEQKSRVSQAVRRLADISAEAEEGAHFGSEEELLERVGVSRPTLRQAARILESEHFLRVRAGQGGGFFAARPSAHDVIRAPARYLRMKGASLSQVYVVTRMVSEEAAVSASRCRDPALIAELEALHRRLEDKAPTTAADVVRDETALARLLARMSGNPAIELFVEIGFSFGLDEQNVRFHESPEDRAWAHQMQLRVCDAVLSRDPDITRVVARRRFARIAEWFDRTDSQGTRR